MPLAMGLFASWPALLNGILFDDELLIFSNPYAQSLRQLGPNLSRDFFYGPGGLAIGYYRPLIKVLFMLEYQAFGARAFGYHALSLLLFALAIALALQLAREIVPPSAATIATCLFASHPAAARSVG
ncbi:MAG TPA: hypothetical protein VGI70_00385, partial [Polyangiales bacterium]